MDKQWWERRNDELDSLKVEFIDGNVSTQEYNRRFDEILARYSEFVFN